MIGTENTQPNRMPSPEQTEAMVKVPPKELLDFSQWELQTPVKGGRNGTSLKVPPQHIMGTGTGEAATPYMHETHFYGDANDGAVVFHTYTKGYKVSVSRTSFPRTELRERVGGGSEDWTWGGTHILEVEEAVTEVPSNGKVVVAQLHGGGKVKVPIEVQYEGLGNRINVRWKIKSDSSTERNDFFPDVMLGQRFTVQIKVVNFDAYVTITSAGRRQTFHYNPVEADSGYSAAELYFKAGNYIQDDTEDYPGEGATVRMYALKTAHKAEVEYVPVTGVTAEPHRKIQVGAAVALKAAVIPADASNKKLTWTIKKGADCVALDASGNLIGLAEGTAVVSAAGTGHETTVFADMVVSVGPKERAASREICSFDFEGFTDKDWTLWQEDGWTRDFEGSLLDIKDVIRVEEENGNRIIRYYAEPDNDNRSVLMLRFPVQTETTTINFKLRVDNIQLKGDKVYTDKSGDSILYITMGGKDGCLEEHDEIFRMQNMSDLDHSISYDIPEPLDRDYSYPGIRSPHWVFSRLNVEETLHGKPADITLGTWQQISLVITPDNGSEKANTTDVYIDGRKVAAGLVNQSFRYLDQIEFYACKSSRLGFSIDEVSVYAGVHPVKLTGIPDCVAIGNWPESMKVGSSLRLIPLVSDGACEDVKYFVTAGRDKIAISDDGLLIARAAGTATVRVSSAAGGSALQEYTLTVTDAAQEIAIGKGNP